MSEIFRVDFYPHTWITNTMDLTPDERGLYIQIISLIYANEKPIPNDPQHIGRVSNCSTRMAKALILALEKKGKIQVQDGFVTNSRCVREILEVRKRREHAASMGRTSAENRRESNKNKDITSTDTLQQVPVSVSVPVPVYKDIVIGVASPLATPETKPVKILKGTRLSEDWELPDEWGEWALAQGMEFDAVVKEWPMFKDYWIAKPGKDGVKLNWESTWRNWVRKSIEYRGVKKHG